MKEPRPANRAGSRKKSVRPGTSPEPAPAQAVLEDLSGLADISSRGQGRALRCAKTLAMPCGQLETVRSASGDGD
jgi:hypothetical protein